MGAGVSMNRKTVVWIIIAVGLAALISLPHWPPSIIDWLGSIPGKITAFILALRGIGAAPAILNPDDVKLFMQIVVTIAVGGASLVAVLQKDRSAQQRQWATGALGFILGYWLK